VRPLQVLARPVQRIVQLQQRRPHPLDAEAPSAAWAPCSGGRSSRASGLYASHGSGDLRALTRALGPRTAPSTIEGRRRGRRIAREPGAPAPATNKRGEKSERQKKHERRKSKRRNLETPRSPANQEDAPRRTAVDPQHLVQSPVERGAVVAELLPEPLLRLSFDEVGRRGVGMLPLLLQERSGSSA
jgi:hypothetical protein